MDTRLLNAVHQRIPEGLLDDGIPLAKHAGRCIGCRRWITANTAKAWNQAVRKPCPHCGRPKW